MREFDFERFADWARGCAGCDIPSSTLLLALMRDYDKDVMRRVSNYLSLHLNEAPHLTKSDVRDIVREDIKKSFTLHTDSQSHIAKPDVREIVDKRICNHILYGHDLAQPKPDAEPQGVWVEPGDVVKYNLGDNWELVRVIRAADIGPDTIITRCETDGDVCNGWIATTDFLRTLDGLPVLGVR